MINKKQIIFFIVAVLAIVAFVAIGFKKSGEDIKTSNTSPDGTAINPAEETDKVRISEKNEHYTIDAVYPKVTSDAISTYFKSYVEGEVTQFKNDTSWVNDVGSASEGMLSLSISYEVVKSSTVQNYIFSESSYTGGAHGLQVRRTFSFDKGGQLLSISGLFTNGMDGLSAFSKLVQKELLKRENAQSDWIADGASPKEENYQAFVVTDEGLTVLFDPYQVAPYAEGNIDIAIPVSSFKSIAKPEFWNLVR